MRRLLLAVIIAGTAVLVTPARAEESPVDTMATTVETMSPVTAPLLDSLRQGTAPQSVDQLKALQEQLLEVTKKVIPCTVNVQVDAAQGSGIIISEDGYVLTAAHVGGRPDRNVVFVFADGTRARGKTLGLYKTLDAGLLKITDEGTWPYAKMGDSNQLKPGQWCIATGHPGGYQSDRLPVVRLGRILGVDPSVIVSDCTLIGGDSGGPLFDLDGNVIGINSRIGTPLNVNMHVPVSTYRESWERLVHSDSWGALPGERPYIGVQGHENTDEARVAVVFPGTPADKAGIKAGDIILKFDGMNVRSFTELVEMVSDKSPQEEVEVVLRRNDETIRVRLTIGRRSGDR